MKADSRQYYENCPECLEFKKTKAQRDTEVSYENLFENFLPGQQVQCDFAEFLSKFDIIFCKIFIIGIYPLQLSNVSIMSCEGCTFLNYMLVFAKLLTWQDSEQPGTQDMV